MSFTVVKLLDKLNPTIITGGLVPRGAYDNATDYAVGDSVDYLGSSYVMYVDAVAGTLPTDTTKWQVIAEGIAPGGTTGQVLRKQSGDNHDADWETLNPDDLDDTATTNKFTTTGDISKLAGIEALADVTDTTNVTAAGALMDSEVDANIKTLSLPASTTISAFGATLVDDADAATSRTTLGLVIGTNVQAYSADNAFRTDKLSVFASTTSAELATKISDETGSGALVFATSPTLVTPALGTPTALVGTNITGTASGLTAGNVTTNANLTGVITSVGNATSIASQTGTGTKFVVDTSPTLVTPILGAASATSLAVPTITTASGALGITPASGSNLNITLATTGDLAVNTNQLYVDTSLGNVGIGTTTPGVYKLNVNGSLIASDYYSGDGTQGATSTVNGLTFKDGLYTTGTISLSGLDHGTLSGLLDDDHTQYALLAGRTGGQILTGGTGVTDTLTLIGTSGIGTLTSPAIELNVGNNGVTNAMTILNNGNVGVGTAAPGAKLSVINDVFSTDANNISTGSTFNLTDSVGTYGLFVRNKGNSAGISGSTYVNQIYTGSVGNGLELYTIGAGNLTLGTSSTARLTIIGSGATAGNVGVGTTSPGTKLELAGATSSAEFRISSSGHFTNNTGGDNLGSLTFYSNETSGGTSAGPMSRIQNISGNEYWDGSGGSSGHLTFWTTGQGGNTLAERLRITNTGNVGIGTTTPGSKLTIHQGDLTFTDSVLGNWRYGGKIGTLDRLAGRQVNNNPDFLQDMNGYSTYDNGSSGSITRTIVTDATAPNSSGRVMNIAHTTAGTPSPGWGGFHIALSRCSGVSNTKCYREGNRMVYRVWAKIPVGYTIEFNSNPYGTGGQVRWISSKTGTGNWEEYVLLQQIGIGGTLGTTGYFVISGSTRPVTWDVASVDVIDIDQTADTDRASTLNVGYKTGVNLTSGNLLSTTSTYLAVDSGNVGIGTTSLGSRLVVKGTGATSATSSLNVTNSSDVSSLFVRDDGRVGIGTNSPSEKFEVQNGNFLLYNASSDPELKIKSGANNPLSIIARGAGYHQIDVPNRLNITVTNGVSIGGATGATINSKLGVYGGMAVGIGYYNLAAPTNGLLVEGSVGIGTTAPTNILSLGGNVARVFASERHTTANTAGNTLTVRSGGATSGATDKAGGALILQGGLSTGSAESGVTIQGCVAGSSGTTDGTQTTGIQVLGNKLAFYNQTPIARAVLATGAGATVDQVITALQNLGLVSQT